MNKFAQMLLVSTSALSLAVSLAYADGGVSGNGTAGGADSATGTGTAGTGNNTGAGGGGAGVDGGAGGTSTADGGGGGGGTGPGGAGQNGSSGFVTGAGGGGGGAHGGVVTITTTNGATITGGNGGIGGTGSSGAPGGGGGAGGYGVVVNGASLSYTNSGAGTLTGGGGGLGGAAASGGFGGGGGTGGIGLYLTGPSATLSNAGSVTGGAGANGGAGIGRGGQGGAGGAGVVGSGFTATNTGTIQGGNGGNIGGGAAGNTAGAGGAGISGSNLTIFNDASGIITGGNGGHDSSTGGAGGAGIIGSNLSIVTSGNIWGGLSGDGGARANAITFTGGSNTLELDSGYSFTGNVAGTGSNTLVLGGAGNASFDISTIGTVFNGFSGFEKTGSAVWTLLNTTSAVTPWTISGGTLSISDAAALGDSSGTLTMDGGTLQSTGSSVTLDNPITLGSGGGTFDSHTNILTLTSAIGGTGALTATGGGTLTLTGNNTYTGATTISSGFLALSGAGSIASSSGLTDNGVFTITATSSGAAIKSLSGAGVITLGNQTLTITNGNATAGNVFSGMIGLGGDLGGLTISGGTEILTGTSGYVGATTIGTGATLQIGNGGTDGTLGAGAVTDNGTLIFDRSDAVTVANAVGGSGGLTLSGGGTLTLTGADTTTGVSTISSGILQLGNGGTTGSITGNIVNNGEIDYNRTDQMTYSDSITGSGSLHLIGNGGSVILLGANDYSGGTTISRGALAVGNQTMTGSLTGDIVDDSDVAFIRADNYTFAGNISGLGEVDQYGNGILTLTGTNTYSGSTVVEGNGALAVAGDANLGTGSVVLEGGSLRFLSSTTSTLDYKIARGAFDTNGFDVTLSGLEETDNGVNVAAGYGGITKLGAGTLILTGTNTSLGPTLISAGTLQIGNGGTTGALSVVNVTDNAALVFDRSDAVTYAGVISGSGSLTQMGSGTLILTGTNTYTGATTISSGTLALSGAGSIASSSGVTDNAIFDISATSSGAKIKSLSGSGSVVLGTRTLTITNGNATSGNAFAGIIGNGGDTGGLTISGGTQILIGTSNYSGATTIGTGATLQIGNGGTGGTLGTGAVTDNGTLIFERSDAVTLANAVTGSGSLTQSGTAALTLTGNNTYTGATTISSGTLALSGAGSISSSSGLADNAIFDISTTSSGATIKTLSGSGSVVLGSQTLTIGGGSFSGAITGSGGLTVSGGTLTLTGANAYGVSTIDNGATLQIGNGGTVGTLGSGAVTDNGTLIFDRSDAMTLANAITGSGGLILSGGAVTLTGANAYGATNIHNGATLQIGNGGMGGTLGIGAVTDNGTLVFNRSNAVAVANAVGGSGNLIQSGAGMLTLSGTNTYTGTTSVNAGTLHVTGSIASSPVSVGSGATLSGTGTVGSVSVANGGVLTPGVNPGPGTLTVNGNLNLASGATYVDYLTPSAAALTNVTGSANLNGTLVASAATGSYTIGQRYTLLTATSGVSGTFSSLSGLGTPPLTKYRLAYDANDVYLFLDPSTISQSLPIGANANIKAAAGGIDAAISAGHALSGGFLTLAALQGVVLAQGVTQAVGAVGTNIAQAVSQGFEPFLDLMLNQSATGSGDVMTANAGALTPKPAQSAIGEMRLWGSAYGGHSDISANADIATASLSSNNIGIAVGGEMRLGEGLLAGASLALDQQKFASGGGTGRSDDFLLGLYAREILLGQGYLAAGFGYGAHDISTNRAVTISGTDILAAKVNATEYGGRVEAGYHLRLDDQYGLTPYAGIMAENFDLPAYAEHAASGASTFALSYASKTTAFAHFELGARLDRSFVLDNNGILSLQASTGWAHALDGTRLIQASFQSLPGSDFNQFGVRTAKDTALLGLSAQIGRPDGFAYGVRLNSQLGSGTTLWEGLGTLEYRW